MTDLHVPEAKQSQSYYICVSLEMLHMCMFGSAQPVGKSKNIYFICADSLRT